MFIFTVGLHYPDDSDLSVVRRPPDDGDDGVGSVVGGGSRAGREDNHVGDENEAADWEDGDDDGDDGVELLVLLSLVNIFSSPEERDVRWESGRLFMFPSRPVPIV